MFCHNCGSEIKEEMAFCPVCGENVAVMQNGNAEVQQDAPKMVDEDKTVILTEDAAEQVSDDVIVEEAATEVIPTGIIATEKIKYCTNCGAVNAENDVFCYSCGYSFAEDEMNRADKKGKKAKKEKVKKEGKKGGKILKAIVGLLVACLLIGCAFAVLKLFVGKQTAPVFYLSGNEIKAGTSDKKVYVMGEDAYADKEDIPNAYRLFMDIVLTKDHKYVFFPQEESNGEYDLYRIPYGKKEAEAQKVAKKVASYTVLSNNTFVYLNSDGKLYLSNMKDDKKIDSDVRSYQLSEDKKQILWITEDDNDIYVQDIKLAKDKKKVASEIEYIKAYTKDFSKLLVAKDEEVILYTDLEDKKKICDSDEILDYYVDGNDIVFYLYEYADEGMNLSAVIDDPDAVSDAGMEEPVLSDYQTTVTKESFWGPRESVETDDAYYDELEKYQKKLERDQFREYIQSQCSLGEIKISYFSTNDMDAVVIYEGPYCDTRISRGSLLVAEIDAELIESVSLSDLMEMDYETISKELDNMLRSGIVLKKYTGEQSVNLDCDMTEYALILGTFWSNGSKSYVSLCEKDGEDATLFEISSDGTMKALCEEFYTIYRCTDEGILYGAEEDDSEIELYWNDENIESDVWYANITLTDDGRIIYFTDMDESEGTLCVYDGKNHEISDDVVTYMCNEDGRISYLYDYSFKKYKGDLMVYANGKSKNVESDVKALLYYTIQK